MEVRERIGWHDPPVVSSRSTLRAAGAYPDLRVVAGVVGDVHPRAEAARGAHGCPAWLVGGVADRGGTARSSSRRAQPLPPLEATLYFVSCPVVSGSSIPARMPLVVPMPPSAPECARLAAARPPSRVRLLYQR